MAQRSLAKRCGYNFLRALARTAALALFRYRSHGREHIPRSGGGLICSNHQSYLDPALVGMSSERRLNYLARRELFRFAPLAWLIDYLDSIPIDRDGRGIAGIKETLRRLKREELVLIFPEGSRTYDGQLRPLMPGFVALARRARVPLIPVAIEGAFRAWPRTARWPRPAAVEVVFGEPFRAEQFERESDEHLVAELDRRIRCCLQEARARLQRRVP